MNKRKSYRMSFAVYPTDVGAIIEEMKRWEVRPHGSHISYPCMLLKVTPIDQTGTPIPAKGYRDSPQVQMWLAENRHGIIFTFLGESFPEKDVLVMPMLYSMDQRDTPSVFVEIPVILTHRDVFPCPEIMIDAFTQVDSVCA